MDRRTQWHMAGRILLKLYEKNVQFAEPDGELVAKGSSIVFDNSLQTDSTVTDRLEHYGKRVALGFAKTK